jgi:hypothetical protein
MVQDISQIMQVAVVYKLRWKGELKMADKPNRICQWICNGVVVSADGRLQELIYLRVT